MGNVLEFSGVRFVRSRNVILDGIDWSVSEGQRWVVIGPNGSGKTTLLTLAAATQFPTSGTVTILGEVLGKIDVFELRPRVGFASSSMADRFPPGEKVSDIVLTAAYSVTGRWREQYDGVDEERAAAVLADWGLDWLSDRPYGRLSDGEKKRVQIARALMTDPELLLLDEPTANLDLGAREELLSLLSGFAADAAAPSMVMVTHHVEEIPEGFTHCLVMKGGSVLAAGAIESVLNSETLSEAFELPLVLTSVDGRYLARAVR